MAGAQNLDQTIMALAADLRPVRPLRSPGVRAALWLGGVFAVALVLACFANLPSIARRLLAAPDMWLAVAGSAATAVMAAMATFQLSVPGRSPLWALLPLPGVLLWLGASGLGCLRGWAILGAPEAPMAETGHCLMFIVGLSIPLSAALLWMVRRACPLRPNLTASVAGLAVAAGAATLLSFFHPYDASATDLLVHAAAVVLVVSLNRVLGGRALEPRSTSRAV